MLKIWLKSKTTQLFFVLWFHISLLNLFFVNKRGAVFLWQENSELNTLLTHFIAALTAVMFYIAITRIRHYFLQQKVRFGNKLFVMGSIVMLVMIGLLIL